MNAYEARKIYENSRTCYGRVVDQHVFEILDLVESRAKLGINFIEFNERPDDASIAYFEYLGYTFLHAYYTKMSW